MGARARVPPVFGGRGVPGGCHNRAGDHTGEPPWQQKTPKSWAELDFILSCMGHWLTRLPSHHLKCLEIYLEEKKTWCLSALLHSRHGIWQWFDRPSPRSSPNKSLKPPKKKKKNPKSHGKNVINTTSPKSSSSEGLSFGLPQVPSHQNPVYLVLGRYNVLS